MKTILTQKRFFEISVYIAKTCPIPLGDFRPPRGLYLKDTKNNHKHNITPKTFSTRGNLNT